MLFVTDEYLTDISEWLYESLSLDDYWALR